MSNTFYLILSICGLAYSFFNIGYVALYSEIQQNFSNILWVSIAWLIMHTIHLVARVELRERKNIFVDRGEGKAVKRGYISPEMRKAILERDDYKCSWCGGQGTIHKDCNGQTHQVDHVIPCSRGGETVMSNLTTACRMCNNMKGDKTAVEFLRYCGGHNKNVKYKKHNT